MSPSATPPGWPDRVPPPGTRGWEQRAVAWLLDHCPADHRAHAVWHKQPLALAWVAGQHINAQVAATRDAYRSARVDLGDDLTPEALTEVLQALESEGLRLLAAQRSAQLLGEALRGKAFVPRL